MKINLNNEKGNTADKNKRVTAAQKKKQDADYQPTWKEIWFDGWTRHTGTVKKGIFQTKLTDKDKERLSDVKQAIDDGIIGTEIDDMKKFTKAHALRLYQQVKEIKRDKIIHDMIANKFDNYKMINTPEQLERLLFDLNSETVVALDTETTGLKWEDTTVGISLTLPKADYHVYIPYGHDLTVDSSNKGVNQLDKETVISALKEPLEHERINLVLHNSKFDVHMLEKDGIDIKDNVYFDTMIAMHILNENEPRYALKPLSNKYGKYFGYEDESVEFSELFGKDPIHFIQAKIALATVYACKDTHLTYLFYTFQLGLMDKRPKLKELYFDIEQPNTLVSIEMERNGFAMDLDFIEQYKKDLSKQIKELSKKMFNNWGEVNTNSPKQLAELFFDKLGYEDPSGKRSTGKDILKKLAKDHDDVKTLLDYRDLNKLYSTYIEPLPKLLRKDVPEKGLKGDYRLHGEFNQSGTVTGRYSSNDPNLQNIPSRARKMIVAPKGKLLIGVDFSQIEPRTLAHMSKDEGLKEVYRKGVDLYSTLASNVYGLTYEQCLEADDETWRTKGLPQHPRKIMKVGLLAVMYGISEYSLAGQLGISKAEASDLLNSFYESYPTVRKFMDEINERANTQGYVETLFGRKRRFIGHQDLAKEYKTVARQVVDHIGELPENIWDTKLPYKIKKRYFNASLPYQRVERQSVNSVIQGSASDILKRAMRDVYYHLQKKDGWKLVGTIHDELLFEIPDSATKAEIEEIERIMIETTQLDVPISVDTEIMQRWGEGTPKEEFFSN